jgi:hypothetical protein
VVFNHDFDAGSTELITVENRSHNIFKLGTGTKNSFFFDQTGRYGATGGADT